MRDKSGRFIEAKYPKKKLVSEGAKRLQNGESDNDLAKWLMNDNNVQIYSIVSFIQASKKLVKKLLTSNK